jgi:glucosamine 6-phosphate synthetase-like amidotransferase/phosphosugar isomerase protein
MDSTDMKKQIMEQGKSALLSVEKSKAEITRTANSIKSFERFIFSGAGDKYIVPLISQFLWRKLSDKPVEVIHSRTLADYVPKYVDSKTCCIFLTQSGKTRDTIDAIKEVKKRGAKCIAITNLIGDGGVYELCDIVRTHTATYPEKATPSTGTFQASLAVLNQIIIEAFGDKNWSDTHEEILHMVDKLSTDENLISWSEKTTEKMLDYEGQSFYFLGDGPRFPVARKAAMIMWYEGAKNDACPVETEDFVHSLIETLEEENKHKKPMVVLQPLESHMTDFSYDQLEQIKKMWSERSELFVANPFEFCDEIKGEMGNLLSPALYGVQTIWLSYHFAVKRGVDPGVTHMVGKIRSGS